MTARYRRRVDVLEVRIIGERERREREHADRIIRAWFDTMTLEEIEFIGEIAHRQFYEREPVDSIRASLPPDDLARLDRLNAVFLRIAEEDPETGT